MVKPRVGWAIAFFGTLSLLLLAGLVMGLSSGELWLPSKGFGVRVQRPTNPIGFHLTAVFYAALAACSTYPLWLLWQEGRKRAIGVARPRAATVSRMPELELKGRVSVKSEGRSGEIRVALDRGSYDFWWEFGGGECLAIVAVPGADEWKRFPVLAAYPRDAFLDALAREIGRLKCPSARYEIEARAILFKEENSASSAVPRTSSVDPGEAARSPDPSLNRSGKRK